jgi:hypothetical protein
MSLVLPGLRTIALWVACSLLIIVGVHCRAGVVRPCSQYTVVTEGYYNYGVTIRVNFFDASLQQHRFLHIPPAKDTSVFYQEKPSLGDLESVEVVFDPADSNCAGSSIVMPGPAPTPSSILRVNCDGWCWRFWVDYDMMGCPVVHIRKQPGHCMNEY